MTKCLVQEKDGRKIRPNQRQQERLSDTMHHQTKRGGKTMVMWRNALYIDEGYFTSQDYL
jgi:hypothetical protein